ncbi:glycosyltransferase family 4 protein [Pontibacter ramchanderi]|uniref:Glycosyltransferase involved in cell wall biosynthesis n=1 Tax=Pontibacter ramchanderi TaxID=1179743 RepID=A0A2N3V3E5_9BACT|nr:glycosyltransferase family 4 protein [Pontibacter ramchanderi]PKV76152.1 glycosyltransferase involved in cell wall biosynthesis [Pontibacter ramchanderi]
MTIGVAGPVELRILDWDLKHTNLPSTNAFPLTSHFINALLKRGFKVIAYTNSTEIAEPMVLESGNLKVCISRQKPQPGRRFFLFEVEDLHKMMVAHPADFISAFWSYEFAWAALKTGKPTVVSLHDVAFQILRKIPDMFRLVRWMINYIVVSKADFLLANSAYTYNQLDRRTKSKTRIIDNFYPSTLKHRLAPTTRKGNYIITVAQGFTQRKNIETGLQAFALLRKQYPDLEYYLVGVDSEEGGLAQQYAEKQNLTDGVRFMGPMPYDEVFQLIQNAQVLLHPSREESFGMVLLEAMIARTPVVGGKNSGYIPHLLNYGKAGLLCDVESPDSMATEVGRILADDELYKALVHEGYTYAEENFSEDVIVKKHLMYYGEVLGKPLEPVVQPSTPQQVA